MASPYLDTGSTASPYLDTGSTGGSAAPAKKSGGGFLGAVESIGHTVASKAELAGHDLKAIPGGAVQLGKEEYSAAKTTFKHPIRAEKADLKAWEHPFGSQDKPNLKNSPTLKQLTGVQVAEHPLRDPFMTALMLAPFFRAAGGATLRGVAASKAADAGEGALSVVKAAAGKPVAGHTGVLGARLLTKGDARIPLHASSNPAVRLVQHGYDKVVQHALDTNPEGRVAAHGAKRIGGSLAETQRRQVAMRDVPANLVESGGAKLGPKKFSPARVVSGKVPRKVQEAALRLTSENSTPEEAAAFHRAQAAEGTGVRDNLKQAAIYDRVAKNNLLTQDEAGNVTVNAEAHPHLAAVDALIAHGQAQVDEIAKTHGLMTEEGLAARRNGPARIRAGATYETPTPGKVGVPSQGLVRQRAYVARLEQLHGRAQAKADESATPYPNVHTTPKGDETTPGPKTPGLPSDMPPIGSSNPVTLRLGAALSVAKDRLQQMETAAAGRVKPTGIVGGEEARPGRGYVTYKTIEPRAPKGRVASAASPVVGKLKSFIPHKAFTGEGLQAGKIPDNTTRLVAQHMRDAYRYVNSDQFRRDALKTGSATKRTSRDVLVRDQAAEDVGKITPELDTILGRKTSNLDTLPTGELDAVRHGFESWRQHIVPGLRDKFVENRQQDIGAAAPDGYKWVDRHVLGDLARPGEGPRGGIGRAADNVNTAVTSATVYFKLGHIGTRFLTNAATNIIQGAIGEGDLRQSFNLWHSLTPLERAKALAAAGQHSFHALPLSEGTGAVSNAISATGRVGARWWAKHADAPFRFNSIAYEARKAGFDTPAKFRDLLDKLENPHAHNMNAAEAAKVDWVGKRANREGIAYDRLSYVERHFITRGLWFYPWTAGASRFAVNTLLEHPYKTAALGTLGVEGKKAQLAELGSLPSYEQGLVRLAGGGNNPLVTDMSTFSPYATPGDVLQTPSVGSVSSYLNPVYAALTQLAMRQNQYGEHTNKPLGDAVSSLFSPTPEAQIVNAFNHKPKPTQMFRKTPLNMLARAAAGPALPRKVNVSAAHSAAARERAGR